GRATRPRRLADRRGGDCSHRGGASANSRARGGQAEGAAQVSVVSAIGIPLGRLDGRDKVTGRARYSADVQLPGTLWGAVLRSPVPHARVIRIDTSRARALSGVHAVLTGADLGGRLYGRSIADAPILAHDRVRFVGEPVAAVAAVDRDT